MPAPAQEQVCEGSDGSKRSAGGRSEGVPDRLVLRGPGCPYRSCPLAGPLIVIGEVTCTDHVQNRQLAGALIAFQDRKVVSLLEHPPKQVPSLAGRRVFFEGGAKPDEVKEHGLAIAPVCAIPRMLRHVGINNVSAQSRTRARNETCAPTSQSRFHRSSLPFSAERCHRIAACHSRSGTSRRTWKTLALGSTVRETWNSARRPRRSSKSAPIQASVARLLSVAVLLLSCCDPRRLPHALGRAGPATRDLPRELGWRVQPAELPRVGHRVYPG